MYLKIFIGRVAKRRIAARPHFLFLIENTIEKDEKKEPGFEKKLTNRGHSIRRREPIDVCFSFVFSCFFTMRNPTQTNAFADGQSAVFSTAF